MNTPRAIEARYRVDTYLPPALPNSDWYPKGNTWRTVLHGMHGTNLSTFAPVLGMPHVLEASRDMWT
ncbi:hypothetical protein PLEOSDRAFT_162426 [Pleurotus ostreatus PC15]|uniref:Uncharacterized protein n=1 Tax=Pleurotus ostreatus (strain PC15) TaxID=1137138 RepID=A0A067NHG8_PLEO1|nr:hypothetical protein PLEOSDRAFT_162426 [Pleurotus ostreatus PC15]